MPKNKGKGGKNRKRGTNKNEPVKRELVLAEDGQCYAQVTKMLGNGRVTCHCFDGEDRVGIIRGKMRKKVWVNNQDIVLLGLRDFQDGKADVIHKFQPDEAKQLQKKGEIPETTNIQDEEETNTADWIRFVGDDADDSEDELVGQQRNYDIDDDSSSSEEDSSDEDDGNVDVDKI